MANESVPDAIIRIYEHRCAVCSFDGVALCELHHQLLDRGALGISEDHQILVSQHVHGGPQVHNYITRFSGQQLRQPQSEPDKPFYDQWGTWRMVA